MGNKAQTSENKRRKRRWPIAAAAVVLACAAILADSRWHLDLTEYTLSSPRLPEGFDGFRIVQLSDLHGMEFGRDNRRLVDMVRSARPNLIAMTGDFIDGAKDLETVRSLCIQLVEIAPCYFVSGNHEAGSGALSQMDTLLAECGVKYLKNEYLPLERGDDQVLLCGVEDPNTWAIMPSPQDVVEQLRTEYPEEYVIFLGHRNNWAEKLPLLDVDLILSGHGHGGIIRLPFAGGVLGTNAELFPEYEAGHYDLLRYDFVVSRGLGGSLPPRFLNRPHIPVIVLNHQA